MESSHRKISFISIISSFLLLCLCMHNEHICLYMSVREFWKNSLAFVGDFTRAVELSCSVRFGSVQFVSCSLSDFVYFVLQLLDSKHPDCTFCFRPTATFRLYAPELCSISVLLVSSLFVCFCFALLFFCTFRFVTFFLVALLCLGLPLLILFFVRSSVDLCVCVFVFCWWKCNFQVINTFLFWKIILGNTLLVSFPAELSICSYQTGPNLVAGGLAVAALGLLTIANAAPCHPFCLSLVHAFDKRFVAIVRVLFNSVKSHLQVATAWTIFHLMWCGSFRLANNVALYFYIKRSV